MSKQECAIKMKCPNCGSEYTAVKGFDPNIYQCYICLKLFTVKKKKILEKIKVEQ